MVSLVCAHCGTTFQKCGADVTKQRRNVGPDVPFFCGRACSGARRRLNKTTAQRVAEKKAYDMVYREENAAGVKTRKAAYFQATYDAEQARRYRQIHRARVRASQSVTINRPEYRQYKQEYDRALRAKEYGPFAECYLLLLDLQRAIRVAVPSRYERMKARGYYDNFRQPQQRRMP